MVAYHRGIPRPLQSGPPLLKKRVPNRSVAVGVRDVPGVDEQPAVEAWLVFFLLLRALLPLSGLGRRRLQVGCDRGRGVSRGGEDPARGLRGGRRVARSCSVYVFF